jgi:hypothetical protein
LRTYYESAEYECEDKPGTFGSIAIIGDEYGPHFIFSTDTEIILDLPIPACEAMAIRYALDRSIKHTMRAGERDGWLTESAERLAEPQPEMTPYGPREIQGPPAERVALPRAADRFVERAPGFTPPAAWVGPVDRQPAA